MGIPASEVGTTLRATVYIKISFLLLCLHGTKPG